MMFTLITMLTTATLASAMSYEQARNEALFLTDKMAYELNLTDAQYEAAYEINLDYLMSVTSRDDVYGICWERRNCDLNFILYSWQWEVFRAASYFFRPLFWEAGFWHFGIYARYPQRDYFYFGRPHFYVSYRGGHSWRSNGGRSYYEHHSHHYRPSIDRHQHTGMRDGRHEQGHFSPVRGTSNSHVTNHHDRTTQQHTSTVRNHTDHHSVTTNSHSQHRGNLSTRSSSAVGHNMGTTRSHGNISGSSSTRHGTVSSSPRHGSVSGSTRQGTVGGSNRMGGRR